MHPLKAKAWNDKGIFAPYLPHLVFAGFTFSSFCLTSFAAEEKRSDEVRASAEAANSEPKEPDKAPSTENDELSAEERALLAAAMGEDAAAEKEQRPSSSTASVSSLVQSMNPNMSLSLAAGFAGFSEVQRALQVGEHDLSNNGFNLQQLEMALSASVDPFARFNANLVFTQEGVDLEEVYATSLSLPWGLQARGGLFLQRFGRINSTHPHAWSFTDQPLLIGKFLGGEGGKALGIETSWLLPLPWFAELVFSLSNATGDCCGESFLGVTPMRHALDLTGMLSLKQFFAVNDDFSAFIGLNAMNGPNTQALLSRTEIYGADVYLRYRPVEDANRSAWTLTAELMHRRQQMATTVVADTGLYVQTTIRFWQRFDVAARTEWVEGLSNDVLNPNWKNGALRLSAASSFYPSHFSRLRAQIATLFPGDERGLFTLGGKPVFALFLTFEVQVGIHPVHIY